MTRKYSFILVGPTMPLKDNPRQHRYVIFDEWDEEAKELPELSTELTVIGPETPILSLDPTGLVRSAFNRACLQLREVVTTRDVPVSQGRYNLFSLAGKLYGRVGLILTKDDVRGLMAGKDKRHLLTEAKRFMDSGKPALLVNCDGPDFEAWWKTLAPRLENHFNGQVEHTDL